MFSGKILYILETNVLKIPNSSTNMKRIAFEELLNFCNGIVSLLIGYIFSVKLKSILQKLRTLFKLMIQNLLSSLK